MGSFPDALTQFQEQAQQVAQVSAVPAHQASQPVYAEQVSSVKTMLLQKQLHGWQSICQILDLFLSVSQPHGALMRGIS